MSAVLPATCGGLRFFHSSGRDFRSRRLMVRLRVLSLPLVMDGAKGDLKMTDRDKLFTVADRHRRRWYFYYCVRILLPLPDWGWMLGRDFCQTFDEECLNGRIRNKRDGRPRKG